jgi:hypothetical protein
MQIALRCASDGTDSRVGSTAHNSIGYMRRLRGKPATLHNARGTNTPRLGATVSRCRH